MIELDAARGLAVLLVVLWHATWYFSPQQLILYQLGWTLESFRMPALMLISGILASPLRERGNKALFNRASYLFWPFLLWLPFNILLREGLDNLGPSLLSQIASPTLELWFLWVLGCLILSTSLLRRIPVAVILVVSLVAASWTHSVDFGEGLLAPQQGARYGFYFYLGFYNREFVLRKLDALRPRHVFLLAGAYAVAHLIDAKLKHSTGYTILASVQALGMSGTILLICKMLAKSRSMRVLHWLGRRTIGIYLAHMPVLLAIGWLMSMRGIASSSATTATAALIAIFMSLLAYEGANRLGLGWLFHRPALPHLGAARPHPGSWLNRFVARHDVPRPGRSVRSRSLPSVGASSAPPMASRAG